MLSMRDTYNSIAKDFDKTRYAMWPCVKEFYKSNTRGYCIDVGCGNGKNVPPGSAQWYELCDLCDSFVELCASKYPQSGVCQVNGLHLPYRTGVFDTVISVAVVHHLNTHDLRVSFVCELLRVLKPGGKGLITCWARTDAQPQDRNVPWHDRATGKTTQRYYHMFDPMELESLFSEMDCTVQTYYEHNNHIGVFTKHVRTL